MIARCARCQGTFSTDRFGRQTCPHCGSELLLQDPNAPQPSGGPQGAQPPGAAPPPPPPGSPPPPQPPAGGYGPPGGFAPPPGGAPPGGFGGPPGGGWGGPPPGPPPELPAPFAERATRGFFSAFFETWKLVATQPAEFFRRVRIDQTGSAILFGVIASTVGTVVAALYQWLQIASGLTGFGMMDKMSAEQERFIELYKAWYPFFLLGAVVLAPLLAFLWTYIVAGIVHLLLMLFRGTHRPFDATLTAVGYANGLQVLNLVPGCGGLIALVWGLVVLVIGLGEIQRCGSGKAALAVFAPVILACVCCCAILGVSAPAFLKELQAATKHGKTVNL